MEIQKIKDKIEILDVQAQDCDDDCSTYTNTRAVGKSTGAAVTYCLCTSRTKHSAEGWTYW